MKRNLYLLLIVFVLMPFSVFGQSYKDLWKQSDEAVQKDLPKTQLTILEKIIKKADKEKQYGHLLKAHLMHATYQLMLSPDSLDSILQNFEAQEIKAEKEDLALAAVYDCIIWSLYLNNTSEDDKYAEKAKVYLKKAMLHPDILASRKASEFEPVVVNGADSEIFGNDLLSVVGYHISDFTGLHAYYEKAGNRRAALMTALEMVKQQHAQRSYKLEGSPYIAALDSLIDCYGDLTECGEVAVERVNYMRICSVRQNEMSKRNKELIQYIDSSLSRWGDWKRMNELRNMRKDLTYPQFDIRLEKTVNPSGKPINLKLENFRNIKSVDFKIARLNITGDNTYDVNNQKDYQVIKQRIIPESSINFSTGFISREEYEVFNGKDVTIPTLSKGAYLLTAKTDNAKIPEKRMLVYVSDLTVISESLPGGQTRMAVVNATSGQPVPGAKVKIYPEHRRKDTIKPIILTCDEKGEVVYTEHDNPYFSVYVYTDDDKCCNTSYMRRMAFYYGEATGFSTNVQLYTDRHIYRPGQTVHLSGIGFTTTKGIKTMPMANRKLKVTLRNANYKEVETKEVETDEYGTFSEDFILPANGLTGTFSFSTSLGNGYANLQVEEYKRPTFEVEFDEIKTKYANGDTLTVIGRAKSYAGVPVQNAKVSYSIQRRKAAWCWWWGGNGIVEDLDNGEAVTDEKGEFRINIPLVLPSWENDYDGNGMDEEEYMSRPRFYDFIAKATVTDLGGESHDGSVSVPLGNKPVAFYCDIAEKSECDSLKSFSFSLRNAAGQPIEGTVRYTIDGKNPKLAQANQPVTIHAKNLKSGRHTIEATCENESVKKEFVVFSMKDKTPCIETHDWFYQTANTFPRDGKPVAIQVGSSDPDTHILYNVIAGNKVLESGAIDQSNALTTRLFTYKEEYGTGLLLTFAWVKEGVLYRHSATIQRPLPEKKMNMQWTTFRDRLTPGQKEEWTLNIKGPDGKAASAQLMATMYDKSLDQLSPMSWNLDLRMFQNMPRTSWEQPHNPTQYMSGQQYPQHLKVKDIELSHFISPEINRIMFCYTGSMRVFANDEMNGEVMHAKEEVSPKMAMAARAPAAVNAKFSNEAMSMSDNATESLADAGEFTSGSGMEEVPAEGNSMATAQVRENLSETAFFYPALLCNEKGDVSVKFTLPESITTWKFIGLAHDKEMNYGLIEALSVAKKDVMVQPNMPRFVRMGDKATISTKIFNTAEKDVSGDAMMQLINPETEQTVLKTVNPFSVKAGETANVVFEFEPTAATPTLLICKIVAAGDGFSDGEQHYLPVLPDREMVINTVPFTQHEAGTMTVDLGKLIPESALTAGSSSLSPRLTVEYTNNPAWLMVQALPFVGKADEKNAISLAAAYYANSIGKHIMSQSERIKTVFNQWQREQGNETSLMSSLEKNQQLKTLVLDETPWVLDAEHEADQKKALANYFDENALNNRQSTVLAHLNKLQNGDGSFSWWEGMPGSPCMTAEVLEFLTRMNLLIGSEDANTTGMLRKADSFLSDVVIKEVEEMKKLEKKKQPFYIHDHHALQWVYINAITNKRLSAKEQEATDYLMNHLEKQVLTQNLYAKAMMAVVLFKQEKSAKALQYVKSLKEYTVYKEEMGRYFDSPRAHYSWCDYRIPTQSMVIEALTMVTPSDQQAIDEMKRWLLQEKRTQAWDTPINSVNAVYAFLNGNTSILAQQEQTRFAVDGKAVELPKATAGLGYVKTTIPAGNAKSLTAEKTSTGTSWGAVYAQFMQSTKDIEQAASGITVTREILPADNNRKDNGAYHVGDKVKVRITIQADRDYDYVQVIDKRAACLEPVNQLSGYHWGYYCSPKDNATNYYIDILSKGRHTIETEYYIDRAGTYETGTCTIQCAYSPEFTSRSKSQAIHVE